MEDGSASCLHTVRLLCTLDVFLYQRECVLQCNETNTEQRQKSSSSLMVLAPIFSRVPKSFRQKLWSKPYHFWYHLHSTIYAKDRTFLGARMRPGINENNSHNKLKKHLRPWRFVPKAQGVFILFSC